MVSSSAFEPEFLELWSSPFLLQPLPDCSQPNLRLRELARTHPAAGVFSLDDPAVEWLRLQVSHGVSQFLQMAGIPRGVSWGVNAQFETLDCEDYRAMSSRPGAYLCGLYFVHSPVQPPVTGRDDAAPGRVSFYDPRTGMNMNAIRQDPYNISEQTLEPESGLLLVWPGFVRCFSHPNLSRERAVRVRFDIRLQR